VVYIFVADSMSLSLFEFFVMDSERPMYFETECIMAL